MKNPLVVVALIVTSLLVATPAEAALIRGIQEVIAGILQLPLSTISGTFSGPPVVGTLFGALSGAVQGIGLVAHGALELAASAVSVAKRVGPYLIPIFL